MHRAYLLGTTGIILLASLCLITFSLIIDPYDIYPDVSGHSPEEKADLFYHLRIHKPYAMQRRRAEHLVVGSSRAASLPPYPMGNNAYNAALPGITLREMRRVVEHAHAIRPVRSLFIAVDYYMFRQGHSDLTEHYEDDRLLRVRPSLGEKVAHRYQRTLDAWRTLFSTDGLLGALATLVHADNSNRHYLQDGTWSDTGPARSPMWLYSMLNTQIFRDFRSESGSLDYSEFRALLSFCADNAISTTVLISPFHGSVMNTVAHAGAWDNYLAWQREVVNAVHTHRGTVRAIGLEHNEAIILEPIRSPEAFFRDGVHYTRQAGDDIMNCALARQCPQDVSIEFITPEDADIYLQRVDRLKTAYPGKNPGDFAALQGWWMRVGSDPEEP